MKKFLFCAMVFFVLGVLTPDVFADTTTVEQRPKSPGKALAWSLLGTVLPVAAGTILIETTDGAPEVAGIVINNFGYICGPSLGYFYGGVAKRGWTGTAIRSGMYGMSVALILAAGEGGRVRNDDPGLFAAAFIYLGMAVYDIVDIAQVDGAVRKRNQRLQQTAWMVMPKYFAAHKAHGLELQIHF